MAHLDQLIEYLKHQDELTVCDLLDISAEDLIERFQDKILSRRVYISREAEILDSSITDEELEDADYEGGSDGEPEELDFSE